MAVVDFNQARLGREAALRKLMPAAPLRGDGGGGISDDMAPALEQRISRLEGAAVAAFVFLIATFGGGYVLLSNQLNDSTQRVEAKLDALIGEVSEVKSGVAVLEERSKK